MKSKEGHHYHFNKPPSEALLPRQSMWAVCTVRVLVPQWTRTNPLPHLLCLCLCVLSFLFVLNFLVTRVFQAKQSHYFLICIIISPGTRIIYERNFLLQMRNSPLAKTPPKNLPVIPGVTAKDTESTHRENGTIVEEPEKPGELSSIYFRPKFSYMNFIYSVLVGALQLLYVFTH